MQSLIFPLYFHYFLSSYHRMTCSCSKCRPSTSNQSVTNVICSTDIISVYLYKCGASSPQPVPVYADPVYGEMAEDYTLKACMKADRMEICERNT